MPVQQGDLSLLQHPVAQELLASKIPARLAYISTDGTPRVVPIWFHWDGRELVMGTPPKARATRASRWHCPRIRSGGGAILRQGARPSLAQTTSRNGALDDANFHHSRMGRHPRLQNTLP